MNFINSYLFLSFLPILMGGMVNISRKENRRYLVLLSHLNPIIVKPAID